jgi:hypothetical protein
MTLWIRLLLCIACACFSFQIYGQDLYDEVHTQKYADYLYFAKQYDKAAVEYKRLLNFSPQKDTALRHLFISLRKSGKYDSGVVYIRTHYKSFNSGPVFIPVEFEKFLILSGRYETADSMLTYKAQGIDAGSKTGFRFYTFALTNRWSRIPDSSINYIRTLSPNTVRWEALIIRQKQLKYKSPGVALALSTLVPGTGKIYTGDWKDGVVSMLIISSMAYESYVGFHTRGTRSVLGWVFGGLTIGFYGGNIYGSWHAAKRYNQRLDNEIHDEAYKLTVSDF